LHCIQETYSKLKVPENIDGEFISITSHIHVYCFKNTQMNVGILKEMHWKVGSLGFIKWTLTINMKFGLIITLPKPNAFRWHQELKMLNLAPDPLWK
jgi:hypothetical protein